MRYKVLADFIYEDGRIHAGQIVELSTDKAQHLIGSGKICPAETEAVITEVKSAIVEPPENTMRFRKHKYAGK